MFYRYHENKVLPRLIAEPILDSDTCDMALYIMEDFHYQLSLLIEKHLISLGFRDLERDSPSSVSSVRLNAMTAIRLADRYSLGFLLNDDGSVSVSLLSLLDYLTDLGSTRQRQGRYSGVGSPIS